MSSTYIHGTYPAEQQRLSVMNSGIFQGPVR